MSEAENEISCPLCGHRFTESELKCHSECPFGEHCQIACCPSCGYQIVRETKTVQWIKRFLRKSR